MKKKTIISALFASVILAMTCAMQYVNAANDSDGKNRIRVFLKNGVTVDFNEDEVDSITTNVASNGTVVEQNFWRNGSCRAFEADKIDSICYYKPTLEFEKGLEFGRVESGGKMRKSLTIKNTGKYPATFKVVDFISSVFSCDSVEREVSIEPGAAYALEFVAEPNREPCKASSRVSLESDNIADGRTDVFLSCDIIEPIAEEVVEAQENSISDIVNNSVDENFNAAEQIAQHKDEIERMESVNEVKIGEAATEVTLVSGNTIIYPYNYPSPFEYDRGNYETVHDEFVKPMQMAKTKANGNGKKAAVFNLFAGDDTRYTQNEMVDQAINTLCDYYGKENVYIYDQGSGSRWFSTWQIQAVFETEDIETIYVSSLGSNDGRSISTLETDFINKNKDMSWFLFAPNSTMYDAALSVNVNNLLARAAHCSSKKLIYFASCNTLNDAMYLENSGGTKDCIIGWSAPNVYGQAYGKVLFDYIFNLGKYASTFMKEAANNTKNGNPVILDPLSEAKLRIIGDFKASGNSTKYTRKQIDSSQEDLSHITKPQKTCDIKYWYFAKTDDYTLKAEIDRLPWYYSMTGGNKSYYNSRAYFFLLNGAMKFTDDVTNLKRTVTLRPGVHMIEAYSSRMSESEMSNNAKFSWDYPWELEDYKFLIINNTDSRNDERDEDFEISMTTAGNISGKLYGIGKTVYLNPETQKRGFEYWKKGTSDINTVYSDMDTEMYFAELTGVQSNTDYVVRAFAYSTDGNIKYSDNTVEVNSGDIVGSVESEEHEYVDLGLPSGTLWATCNVGANSPEEYGDYFAWGETKPKDVYDWSTYKWCNGSYDTQTKYCTDSRYGTVDNKTTLDLSDDAAHVNWGGSWRMPTRAEQDELREKCTWTWTTQNGKNGYNVTSKINGNSIFLPAAGYRGGSSLNSAGSGGNYWSSSLSASNPGDAYNLGFNSGDVDWDYDLRYYGQSVRAVYDNKQESQKLTTLEPHYLHVTIPGAQTKDLLSLRMNISEELNGKVKYHGYVVSTHPIAEDKDLTPYLIGSGGTFYGDDVIFVKQNNQQVDVEGYISYTNVYTGAIYSLSSSGEKLYIIAYANTTDGEIIKGNQIEYTPNTPIDAPTKESFVDLGASVMWASCNYGGNAPTDYGLYYVNNEALELSFGNGARLPSEDEWDELEYKKSVNLWIGNDDSSKNGVLFVGSNGNSIFCPYGGIKVDSTVKYSGEGYWYNTTKGYWGLLGIYRPSWSRDEMTIRLVRDKYSGAKVAKAPRIDAFSTNSVPYKISEMNGRPLPGAGSFKHE